MKFSYNGLKRLIWLTKRWRQETPVEVVAGCKRMKIEIWESDLIAFADACRALGKIRKAIEGKES